MRETSNNLPGMRRSRWRLSTASSALYQRRWCAKSRTGGAVNLALGTLTEMRHYHSV